MILLHTYGLGILKSLALDHANCLRIGETRGLIAKLVDFINVIHRQGGRPAEGSKTIRQSLQLLNVLASTTGTSGSILRPAIVNVVSAIPHLRDILHYQVTKLSKDSHVENAVDVLKHLALDKHSREVIGSTGGVISNLMLLFTRRSLYHMPFQHRYSSLDDASTKEAAVKVNYRKISNRPCCVHAVTAVLSNLHLFIHPLCQLMSGSMKRGFSQSDHLLF